MSTVKVDNRLSHFVFVFKQLATQALGFCAGIMVIRGLPKEEYALYTVGMSMLFMMNTMCDMGLSSGFQSIGGKNYNVRTAFTHLFNTAYKIRGFLMLGALVVTLPLATMLFIKNNATFYEIIILLTVMLVGFISLFNSGLYRSTLQLQLRSDLLGDIGLTSALFRIVTVFLLSISYLNSCNALLILSISFLIEFIFTRKFALEYIDPTKEINSEYKKQILKIVRLQAPNTIYYLFSCQLSILLLSLFGKTQFVAEFGALDRLASLLVIIIAVIDNLVCPRLARAQSKEVFLRYLALIAPILLAVYLTVLSVSYWFPRPFLIIIGNQYSNLSNYLPLMMLNLVGWSVNGTLEKVNASKGWILKPYLLIPIHLVTQIVLLFLLDMKTLQGAILLPLLSNGVVIILRLLQMATSLRKLTNETAFNIKSES